MPVQSPQYTHYSPPSPRRCVLSTALLVLVPVTLRAEELPSRFHAPTTIELLAITSVTCSAPDNPHDRCLTGRLMVHHHPRGGAVFFDVATYPLDQFLEEHLRRDFGPLHIIAQHKIYSALRYTLLPGEQDREAAEELITQLSPFMVYRLLPRVSLPVDVERLIHQLAQQYRKKTGRLLVITSGTRTPRTQARAMYTKLARGANLRRLYRKKEAIAEVIRAYRKSRKAGARPAGIIAAMAEVISAQVDQGLYLSPHLRAGAVDLRSRNMNRRSKRALRRLTSASGYFKLNREERVPPHFHLEVYTGRMHRE